MTYRQLVRRRKAAYFALVTGKVSMTKGGMSAACETPIRVMSACCKSERPQRQARHVVPPSSTASACGPFTPSARGSTALGREHTPARLVSALVVEPTPCKFDIRR